VVADLFNGTPAPPHILESMVRATGGAVSQGRWYYPRVREGFVSEGSGLSG
jgi:hypothetical protein